MLQFKTLRNTNDDRDTSSQGDSLTPKKSPNDTMLPSMSPKITSVTKNVTISPHHSHCDTLSQNDTKRHTVRVGSQAFTILQMVSLQHDCSLKKAVDLIVRAYVTNGDSVLEQ